MNYILFKDKYVLGVFDTKTELDNMKNGLISNNLVKCDNLHYKIYKKNSICEVNLEEIENNFNVKNKNVDNKNVDKEDSKKEETINLNELSEEELDEYIKNKYELEKKLSLLKKEKERIEESKEVYKNDIELYKKFKEFKEEDCQFEIPELFIKKYDLFQELEKNDQLNWETFYANYKVEDLVTSYDNQIL